MTFREKLMQEHPENCGRGKGGCIGCPGIYGYETGRPCLSNFCWESVNCTECWDREIPETCNQTCNDCKPDCNQSAKADAGKPRLTLVPTQIIYDIAEVREYGNRKYPDGGPDNWKQVEAQRYRDAAFRHFLAYITDPESVDQESGIKHRKHLECNLAFLAEMEDNQ